jgi:hypothetical protein
MSNWLLDVIHLVNLDSVFVIDRIDGSDGFPLLLILEIQQRLQVVPEGPFHRRPPHQIE